jgi:GntP family permease
MGLFGILAALTLLIFLAYRGWSVLLLSPAAALLAAALAGEPLLAHWTQTFMGSAARFIMQFFPIFLLGALFGKLMEDSGSVTAIANFMTERLGPRRAVLAVVFAGALVTYGGISLFVAFFVLAPMAHALFRSAGIPKRLMPAAIALGTSTFTMSALPGTPAIQNAIPMRAVGALCNSLDASLSATSRGDTLRRGKDALPFSEVTDALRQGQEFISGMNGPLESKNDQWRLTSTLHALDHASRLAETAGIRMK